MEKPDSPLPSPTTDQLSDKSLDEGIDTNSSGIYDKEIKALQQTLEELGVDDTSSSPPEDCLSQHESPQIEKSDSLEDEIADDIVPMRLISLSPNRHPALTGRRRSDPGTGRVNLYHTRNSPFGSSDSEDDDLPERSPRARSPRRFFAIVPEEGVEMEGAVLQGYSPRRRIYHQSRHTHSSLTYPDESPTCMRRGRTKRSNSLPLPDLKAFGVGEAVGAVATFGNESVPPSLRQQLVHKRGRRFSIDDHPLEAIMEESTELRRMRAQPRRYSQPETNTIMMQAMNRKHLARP